MYHPGLLSAVALDFSEICKAPFLVFHVLSSVGSLMAHLRLFQDPELPSRRGPKYVLKRGSWQTHKAKERGKENKVTKQPMASEFGNISWESAVNHRREEGVLLGSSAVVHCSSHCPVEPPHLASQEFHVERVCIRISSGFRLWLTQP